MLSLHKDKNHPENCTINVTKFSFKQCAFLIEALQHKDFYKNILKNFELITTTICEKTNFNKIDA